MICSKCGQEIPDQGKICSVCGEPVAPSDDEASVDAVAENETAETPEDALLMDAPPRKKLSPLTIALTSIIFVMLIALVYMAVALIRYPKTGRMPGSSVVSMFSRLTFDEDAVAATIQGTDGNTLAEISNRDFSYYYWGEVYYHADNSKTDFDFAEPLDEQKYDDTQSWQEYFMHSAFDSILEVFILKTEAENSGFQMPEDYLSDYTDTVASLSRIAAENGFPGKDDGGDVLAYIRDTYGADSDLESFEAYLMDSFTATAYSNKIYDSFSYSDDDLDAYYEEHSEELRKEGVEKDGDPNVSVRHILITPELNEDAEISEDAMKAAKAEAERILKKWKAGDASEESFGDLAEQYSADTGSNTAGGLYENVAPGEMVDEFNDWIFDDARKPGDTGIIKTSYGYHVMYFVEETENVSWKKVVEQALRNQDYDLWYNKLINQYAITAAEDMDYLIPGAYKAMAKNQ